MQFHVRAHCLRRFFAKIPSRLAWPTEFVMKSHENFPVVDMHIQIFLFQMNTHRQVALYDRYFLRSASQSRGSKWNISIVVTDYCVLVPSPISAQYRWRSLVISGLLTINPE